jgi:hypothetical protein
MLAGGKKKGCGRKVPMGLPRLPFAKAIGLLLASTGKIK